MKDADWDRLVRQLRRGDCTPLLGAGACSGRLPTGRQLSQKFAGIYKYPFTDVHNLPRVMHYAVTANGDPVDLKHQVCSYLQEYAPPADDPPPVIDPHEVLAQFPIRTFLTTNYDDFMATALLQEKSCRKNPTSTFPKWWDTEEEEPHLDLPTHEEPLIYHLHGRWDEPGSLVLTDDDYLTYLVNMVEARAANDQPPLPSTVIRAMTSHPLLFVGYSLQDWNFRVLFHGLLKAMPLIMRRRHISVQLMPDLNESVADAADRAREYLEKYLNDWSITIFIGTTQEFFEQLRWRM
ncbi:SIR2 family NAD-dependent protein deacylase [Nonomuraea gerenzanensis]|uniref:SIR2 family NAD-dependent protein deacylase n=1 Tax=Nonomuraea gerenzanensis TaxID=93944 RepID=UPI001CD952D3|nr:SIR2 family protein [Nonomuraea gerenzanensis]UBU13641.1 SIR2 family protein [Nonomuraea gerenzanensis]